MFFIIPGEEDSDFGKSEMNSPLLNILLCAMHYVFYDCPAIPKQIHQDNSRHNCLFSKIVNNCGEIVDK